MSNINDFVIEDGVLKKYTGAGGNVVIPDGVTCIDGWAFAWCRNLTSVTIPEGVANINCEAFYGCENLAKVEFLGEETSVDGDAFVDYPKLIDESDFVVVGGCLLWCNKNDEELIIPDGVKTIVSRNNFGYEGAFINRENIKSIRIPKSVKKITGTPFYGCGNLETIHIYTESVGENMFGSSGKTIEMFLYEDGKEPLNVIGAFRKDYYSQSFNIKKDCLLPIGDDIPSYDKLVACGKYEGFQMNDDGRVKAMLLRLADKQNPVDKEIVEMFAEFLAGKLSKVVAYAEKRENPGYIALVRDIGAVPEDKKKKFKKQLEKSAVDIIRQMAEKLDDIIPLVFECNAETPQEECDYDIDIKYIEHLKAIQAKSILLKYNIEELPTVLTKSMDKAAPKEYLQLILVEYLIQEKKFGPYTISQIAEEVASFLDRNSLSEALNSIYEKANNKKIFAPVVARFCNGEIVQKVYREFNKTKWSQDFACEIVLLSDEREMMFIADKEGFLDIYADMRDLDENQLRDTVLYDFGFNSNGVKVFTFGEKQFEFKLSTDLSLCVKDIASGKISKSVPKKALSPELYKTAQAEFDKIKKNVKKAVKTKSATLFELFLSATAISKEYWIRSYLDNPLLYTVARLLVWEQDGETFTLKDGMAIRVDGSAYTIGDSKIKLAHPMEMNQDDVVAWQKYFVNYGLKQPFEQIWEPVVASENVQPDRYKGCMIPFYRFKGREKHGIIVKDFDYHNDIDISLVDCCADIERIDWARHEIDMNHRFEIKTFSFEKFNRQVNHIVTYFDRITIYDRIANDDISVEASLPHYTIAQIVDFINVANENNATNILSLLLDYKNKNFAGFDPMEEFVLD